MQGRKISKCEERGALRIIWPTGCKSPIANANEKSGVDVHPFAPENSMKRKGIACCGVLALVLLAVPVLAQQSPAAASPASAAASAPSPEGSQAGTDRLKELDRKVTAAQYSADNAWMLVSAAL